MTLLTVGLNHITAPLSVRETAAFPPEQFDAALDDFLRLPHVHEGAILSTCNRTELYAVTDAPGDGSLRRWLCEQRGLNDDDMAPYFYIHRDRETVRHSLRVAAGLDSMILGEPQILGQMKNAYRSARAARGAGPLLTRLFEHSFAVAKQIRSQTEIGANPVSVAYAGVSLARQIFADLSETSAMFIGAGETVDLAARYLAEAGVQRMIFANRSVERAQELATRYHGYAIALEDVATHLAEADMLISSTAAPGYLVDFDDLRDAVRQRRRKPMFALDLAVPRDIDPAAGKLEDIYLYSVDDLQSVIDDNRRSREKAATLADGMLDGRIEEYIDWLDSRQAIDTIRDLRHQAYAAREDVLAKARRRLARGENADDVLAYLAHTLTNKLMHDPSATLRKARGAHQQELLTSARDLFQLDNETHAYNAHHAVFKTTKEDNE
ncbi:Glutamyl-tRNA reductase protein [Salinisphaera shabanensis E1L3A]|uniref:Glutamyl-tRNA reductase n=1 Tax=Salinisphaera shabanensis E1L3A TaxID=1033802 RepID=U2FV49_9GAMM|nr:glutamyl-tRNA reductase [Salinisphaera shabanensis]ERJ19799.1 Glutamyl-tRNA reductase protein [Salinisphaera shabanensis E1L3A]